MGFEALIPYNDIAKDDPNNDPNICGDPYKTLFVARLNYETSESKVKREFEAYCPIKRVRLVTNKETNKPRGYAFIEYMHTRDMKAKYKQADGKKLDNRRVLVDIEQVSFGELFVDTVSGSNHLMFREIQQSGRPSRPEESGVRDEWQGYRELEKSRERGREQEREKSRERSHDRPRDRDHRCKKKVNHLSNFKPSKSTSKSSTGIAFKSTHEDTSETCEDDDDLSDEELAKFAKKFRKFFRRKNDLGKSYKPSSSLERNTLGNDDKRASFDKSRKPLGIQCHKCHGFGHIQSECANTLKEKMKKGLKVIWDDDSGDDDSESGFQIGGEGNSSASVATVDSPVSPKLLSVSYSSSLESIESDKSSVEVKIAKNVEIEGEKCERESIHEAYDLMYQEFMKQGKRKNELETSLKIVEKEKMSLREDITNTSQELDELKKGGILPCVEMTSTSRELTKPR
ncbi:hypothetical protein RHGRI_020771 [Rhododendron griersonianum]|uniref:U1 small nuclear ribonucleoprotein 70 kDa n=1 Tax=Rhododendron griersonianum TaxID=479676 RepID=A0AAV6JHH4_9ERIC|nr:hypothetical protein RHGRI_020771 [Rhododendron griersonianum]